MPLPFILGGIALAAGVAGAKKAVDAHSTMKEAQEIFERAERRVSRSERRLKDAKKETNGALESLGKQKVTMVEGNVGEFISNFKKIKNIKETAITIGGERFNVSAQEAQVVIRDVEGLQKAVASVGSGTIAGGLTAFGAYSLVGSLGAASTGTAISALGGAAATNATLAWLGGGSLAAGGFGVAGGMAVLGGLVAGPAILVGSIFLSNSAKESLSEAKEARAESRAFETECDCTISVLNSMKSRADQVRYMLARLDELLGGSTAELKQIISSKGTDWSQYSESQKKTIGIGALLVKTCKMAINTPLLNEKGELTKDSDRLLSNREIAALLA